MFIDSPLANPADLGALAFFLLGWGLLSQAVLGRMFSRPSLTTMMDHQRENWMRTMSQRELRMIDTSIMSGLQQGTAFFASSCLLAIGGCFALFGSKDTFLGMLNDFQPANDAVRAAFETKVLGLIAVLCYAFFKFGWSYRLFNYCSILVGAVPSFRDDPKVRAEIEVAVARAATMNILGGRHFNEGLRAIFFAIAYLGWFIAPWMLVITTVFILGVLIRRQFFSSARQSVMK
jgi:uncharacterized membrane protein